MIKKLLKTILLTLTLTTTLLTPVFASTTDNLTGWYYNKDTTEWQYYTEGKLAHDGLIQVKDKMYYIDSLGNMETGWITYGNNLMNTENNGSIAKDSWKTISGKKYYFSNSGIMLTGTINLGGTIYNLAEDGYLIQ